MIKYDRRMAMNKGDKFLPIGTVCTISGNNKKVMITGFFAIEYNGNVKMYDYSGCDYPEGLLIPNKTVSFNHTDIQSIQYLGYISDEYDKFNSILNRQVNDGEKEYITTDILSNIQFDANGVVIYDPVVKKDNQSDNMSTFKEVNMVNIMQSDVSNPFVPAYVAEEINNNQQTDTNDWSIFKDIRFDENGTVISAIEYTAEELEQMKENK
jgi:hypothetical protein